MNDCLFCKIIEGEVPSTKVYEDEKTLAFLDINPVNPGHTLVIPKKHSRNVFNIEKEDLRAITDALSKLLPIVKKSVNAEGINIANNNEAVSGQIIFHTHFHIIPRFEGDGMKLWTGKAYKEGQREKIAEKIKRELK